MIRSKQSKPEQAAVVLACGVEIATGNLLHYYNHNLITEMRLLF